MPHKEIIEDICSDCPKGSDGYCTLKEILIHSGMSNRTLEQMKVVEIFKWHLSVKEGEDVGWQKAWEVYTREYAAKYAEVYQDGMRAKELYRLVVGDINGNGR